MNLPQYGGQRLELIVIHDTLIFIIVVPCHEAQCRLMGGGNAVGLLVYVGWMSTFLFFYRVFFSSFFFGDPAVLGFPIDLGEWGD